MGRTGSHSQASVGRNAGYNLAGALIPLLFSLATVPLYLRLIGPDRYGVLAIAWLLLGYFGLFDLGLGRATAHRIAALRNGSAEDRATTFWSAVAVNFAMGVIGGITLWIAADWFFTHIFKVDPAIRPEIVAGVPYLAFAVPIATLTGVLTGALQGREQFLRTNFVSVSSTILFQLFPLAVAWFWGPDLPRLLLAALVARLGAVGALWILCHTELARGYPVRVRKDRLKELLRFGGWVSLTSLIGPLLSISDRFLIGGMLGASAVTVYSIPFQLTQRFGILPGALMGALFPRLSAVAADEQRRLGDLAFRTLMGLMTPPIMAAIFVVGPFLELWVGPEIGGKGTPIAHVLLVNIWLNAFALVPLIKLQARGRPDLVAKILLVQVVPYLVALILAMEAIGLLGVAIVSAIRCFADYLLLSFTAERRIAGLPLVLGNLAMLVAAIILLSFEAPLGHLWWAGATLFLGAASVVSWIILPADLRHKVRALAGFKA